VKKGIAATLLSTTYILPVEAHLAHKEVSQLEKTTLKPVLARHRWGHARVLADEQPFQMRKLSAHLADDIPMGDQRVGKVDGHE